MKKKTELFGNVERKQKETESEGSKKQYLCTRFRVRHPRTLTEPSISIQAH